MWSYPVRKYTLLSFESLLSLLKSAVCPFYIFCTYLSSKLRDITSNARDLLVSTGFCVHVSCLEAKDYPRV